jgi:acetyl esterase/lipase
MLVLTYKLVFTYTLVPEAQCPTPLREVSATLSYLIDATRRRPSTIINARDSAGVNLTVSCTSHLQHPHPRVPVGQARGTAGWTCFDQHMGELLD